MFRSLCIVLVKFFYKCMFSVTVEGLENIPETGAFVLCGNHKSNFDPPLVLCFCKRPIFALVKAELFKHKIPAMFFNKIGSIPVRRGENDINAVKKCLATLKNGNGLLIFPQGTRCKTLDPADFKPGAVSMAKKTDAPLLPFGINGDYKFRKKIKLTFGAPVFRSEIETAMQNGGADFSETVFLAEKIKTLAEA